MRMKIGPRILTGYLAAIAVFLAVGITAFQAQQSLVEINRWVAHSYQVKTALYNILVSIVSAESGQRGFLLTGDERFLEPYTSGSRNVTEHTEQVRTLVADNPKQAARVPRLQAVTAERLEFLAKLTATRRAQKSGPSDPESLEGGKRAMDTLRQILSEMEAEENTLLAERQAEAAERSRWAAVSLVAGTMIASVVVIILSLFIQRSITNPLQSFMSFAEQVRGGDLRQRSNIDSADELGTLAGYLDRMTLGLKDVALESSAVAEEVNAVTSEILASTQQQAASTAEQAAAVQQANSTMTELTQSGAQISDRAKQVATAAEAVASASVSGLQSVQNTNSALERIQEQAEAVAQNVISLSEKTQAVGDIIASVNDISEQSHLLALNASIQAAAAGEHGRSFAVVAGEMKNLAAQSKQATGQVRTILGEIQKGINTSVMLVEEAVKRAETGKQQAETSDRTIRDLSKNLEESIRAFQQIVAGSAQQQIGFEQLSQAFKSISVAAQETASSTKQSEKAASHLSTLSQRLKENVRRYRV